jgi:hypothetical protein
MVEAINLRVQILSRIGAPLQTNGRAGGCQPLRFAGFGLMEVDNL